jgi:diketogulonate reductase-like aldo/keto reductase
MDLTIRSTIRLNNEVEIPRLGLGVYQTPAGSIAEQAVTAALDIGYRHVDTARIYDNEHSVGEAVCRGPVPREELFVTTKLWNADHGYDRAISACRRSLDALGLEYVDLYLIHWPVEGLRGDSWRALEALYEEGLCRSIGVSNYMIRHLEELLDSCRVVPAVNQVEFSPFLFQEALLEFCREAGIVIEAYSPLTKAQRLTDPRLVAIAERHQRTTAQILIRWALQHDMVVLPKSEHPARIQENAAVFDFELSAFDMQELDGLDEGLRTSWDPTDQP